MPTSTPSGFAIVDAAKAQDIERIRATLPFALPGFIDQAIHYCAELGFVDGLAALWEQGSPVRHTEALGVAARKGQVDTLRFMLGRMSPNTDTTNAFGDAIVAGSPACIELLLAGANVDEAVRDLIYDEIAKVDLVAEHVTMELVQLAVEYMPEEALPAMRSRLQARDLAQGLDAANLPARPSCGGPRL